MKQQNNKTTKKQNQIQHIDGYMDIPKDASELLSNSIIAFNKGNFNKARKLSLKILKSGTKKEKTIAEQILKMISVDKTVLNIALFSLIILFFIFIWAIKISH